MAESNHFALHLDRYLKTLSQQGSIPFPLIGAI